MTCTGPECDRPAVSRGLCRSHRKQQDSGRVVSGEAAALLASVEAAKKRREEAGR